MGERGKASQWRMCAWQHNRRKGVEMSHPYTLFVHSSVVLTSVSPATNQDHEDLHLLGSRLKIQSCQKHVHIQLRILTHHIHLTSDLCSGLKKGFDGMYSPRSEMFRRDLSPTTSSRSKTAAIAQRVCRTQDGGVLRIDSACTYPSVHHRCTCFVLPRADIPEFLQQFLQRIYEENLNSISACQRKRGSFSTSRGVRHCCPTSGFLFTLASDPILR